jgi:hypothetical protein
MIWRRRCLVLVPVLSFLAAVLIMSCGGSSSDTATALPLQGLIGMNVCVGSPPIPTPKPTATNGHVPTVTPTPICTPIALSTTIPGINAGSNTAQFNAQGIFGFSVDTTNPKYLDITNANNTGWFTIPTSAASPGLINYDTNGAIVGLVPGCTYFTVSAGGFSQSVLVGVATPVALCSPLPFPVRSSAKAGVSPATSPQSQP